MAAITISERAVSRIKELISKRDKPSIGIKVKVKHGGCSGLSYVIEYAEDIDKYDEIIETDGIKVIIDSKALLYIIGSNMDFIEEKFKSGFVFNNPNQKGSCGCGESFHV